MRVSIITTCYNREATIRDTIESVLAQDYPNIEYIVVDGASRDGSLGIIREYRDRISTIISRPDSGMYEAINRGIAVATGEVVGVMHSDDIFYSNIAVSEVVALLKTCDADLVFGDGLFVDQQNQDNVIRNWISGEYSAKKVRYGWLPLHPTVYIRRELFHRLGCYDESYQIAADSDLLVRYLRDGALNIAYLNKYIVRMRMGGLSTDPKRMFQKWSEDLRLYRSHGINPYRALCGKILSKIPQLFRLVPYLSSLYL